MADNNGLSTIADLKADPDNPRRIDDEAAAGLAFSLEEFGDISGVCFNVRTGELVSGHQRVEQLKAKYGTDLPIVGGAIETPDGQTFAVRFVDWDKAKQRRANIAANNQFIAGEFTTDIGDLLLASAQDNEEMYKALRFDALNAVQDYKLPDFTPVGEETQGKLDELAKKVCPSCGYEF